MKLKNIWWAGLSVVALVSCEDYLEVDAPSSSSDEFVYTYESEITRALNGVYAKAIVNDLYGNAYQRTFIYNSDVDMQVDANAAASSDGNAYARFDCNERGGEISKYWAAAYRLIEYAKVMGYERFDVGFTGKSFQVSEIFTLTNEEWADIFEW